MPVAATPENTAEIYIDESSQTRNRFLLLGGIIIPPECKASAAVSLHNARSDILPHGEMKWGKVSRSKISAYENAVEVFFRDESFKRVHFHSLIVDTHQVRHHIYNDGNREVGFNKEIYQLASKFARLYPWLFHLYPDQRDTTQDIQELRLILNRGRKKVGDRRDWPFRRCHFRDSKKEPFLQLVDILLGALGYKLNGHSEMPDASTAKRHLSAKVLSLAGIRNPLNDTAKSGKYTVWHRRLRG